MTKKRYKINNLTKNAIKICVFFAIANLPFLTITQMIGLDTFIDSFENPNYYYCVQGKSIIMQPTIKQEDYIILQKSSHPNFNVEEGDIIFFIKNNGEPVCHKVYDINSINSVKKYQTVDENNDPVDKPIYESQITGKIMNIIEGNIWNMISTQIWEASIHDYNINALFLK